MKHNKLKILITILSVAFLLNVAFIFWQKNSNFLANQKSVTFSILKHKIDNLEPSIGEYEEVEPDSQDLSASNKEIVSQPIIAILIDGSDLICKEDVIELPPEINFGVLSGQKDNKLSPHGLMLNIDSDQNYTEESLDNIVSNIQENQGIYSSNENDFVNLADQAELLLSKLKDKNIIYLCGKTDKNAFVYQLAAKMSFPILANDVILDEVISPEAINNKLLELEKIAQKNGFAIAMGSPYPLTIELLKRWIPSLEEKGIKIAPINEFYKNIEQYKLLNLKK
jgi:polysaccharide deacetylase 2 family uncharacterized protein YibQ